MLAEEVRSAEVSVLGRGRGIGEIKGGERERSKEINTGYIRLVKMCT